VVVLHARLVVRDGAWRVEEEEEGLLTLEEHDVRRSDGEIGRNGGSTGSLLQRDCDRPLRAATSGARSGTGASACFPSLLQALLFLREGPDAIGGSGELVGLLHGRTSRSLVEGSNGGGASPSFSAYGGGFSSADGQPLSTPSSASTLSLPSHPQQL
jgi:hypothetical protein